jgi:hypothetical protein
MLYRFDKSLLGEWKRLDPALRQKVTAMARE